MLSPVFLDSKSFVTSHLVKSGQWKEFDVYEGASTVLFLLLPHEEPMSEKLTLPAKLSFAPNTNKLSLLVSVCRS